MDSRKSFPVAVKDADQGLVEATIATFDVVDKDADVTRSGFFGTQENVPILWGHNWQGLPLGVGTITEQGSKAVFTGGFNLNTEAGREAFETVKFQGPAQQWSYGYRPVEGGARPLDPSKNDGARRELKPTPDGTPGAVFPEVSAVVMGAGEGTGTTGVKAVDASMTLVDHVRSVTDHVAALVHRLTDVKALRAERGQTYGAATLALLPDLKETAKELVAVADETPAEPEEADAADAGAAVTDNDLLLLVAVAEARQRGF